MCCRKTFLFLLFRLHSTNVINAIALQLAGKISIFMQIVYSLKCQLLMDVFTTSSLYSSFCNLHFNLDVHCGGMRMRCVSHFTLYAVDCKWGNYYNFGSCSMRNVYKCIKIKFTTKFSKWILPLTIEGVSKTILTRKKQKCIMQEREILKSFVFIT